MYDNWEISIVIMLYFHFSCAVCFYQSTIFTISMVVVPPPNKWSPPHTFTILSSLLPAFRACVCVCVREFFCPPLSHHRWVSEWMSEGTRECVYVCFGLFSKRLLKLCRNLILLPFVYFLLSIRLNVATWFLCLSLSLGFISFFSNAFFASSSTFFAATNL